MKVSVVNVDMRFKDGSCLSEYFSIPPSEDYVTVASAEIRKRYPKYYEETTKLKIHPIT